MCYHSCETCFGSEYDNCQTCSENDGRVFQMHTCICGSGKIDYYSEEKCGGINFLPNLWIKSL